MSISSRDYKLLVQHILRVPRTSLLQENFTLTPQQQILLDAYCARREVGEPIAKIIGKKAFWKHEFLTTQHTLDPRPESEHMIEAVLHHRPNRDHAWRILDMGTGTACLLLSLLHEYPHAMGTGIDISAEALSVAHHNATALSLQDRANFMNLSWTELPKSVYDIIITNPPYIPLSDIEHLDVDVKQYDPLLALDGGEDGLKAYRQIFQCVRGLLTQHGLFICEIGINQQHDVCMLGEQAGLQCIEIVHDLANIPRVLVFLKA
jgi:release factor glutamine methyltransferase